MRIEWASICRQIQQTPDGIILVHPGQDMLFTPSMPIGVKIPVALAVVANFAELDIGKTDKLRLQILGPDLDVVQETTWTVPVESDSQFFIEGWEGKAIQPVPVVFQAEKEGVYLIKLSLDGDKPTTLPYLVRTDLPVKRDV